MKNTKKKKTFTQWLKRYYPVPAGKMSAEDAVEHSLLKWRGIAARRGYSITVDETYGDLHSGQKSLAVDNTTCALCASFWSISRETPCERCPLYKARNDTPCYMRMDSEDSSPYDDWVLRSQAKPMVEWLKVTKALIKLGAL